MGLAKWTHVVQMRLNYVFFSIFLFFCLILRETALVEVEN